VAEPGRILRAGLGPIAISLLGACAGAGEGVMGPVIVPFDTPAGDGSPAALIYQSVIQQCREAARDGDPVRLGSLLDHYDRQQAPEWARDVFGGLRQMHEALRFSGTGLAIAALRSEVGQVTVGEDIPLTLVLRSAWDHRIRIEAGRSRGGTALYLEVLMRCEDATGNVLRQKLKFPVPLPGDIVLRPGEEHREPLPFPTSLTEGAVLHVFEFRGELAPARVVSGGSHLIVHRIPLGACTVRVLPRGFEAVQRAPLTTLREALRLGDRSHFPHVYLACEFLPPERRGEAGDLLTASLRTASPELSAVVLAGMRKIFGRPVRPVAGIELPVTDRDDWLAWWRDHESEFR
jgi:hypothetical protein